MSRLRISDELRLPVDAVTETFAILAKRGAGKTYAASVLVEEMLDAKLQVVVLDPMGAWWGLRSSADGKGPGFPIAILGGDRGDVPLEPAGGTLVADLVVDEGLSAILDLSAFSKTDRRRFVAELLERLYARNRDAMHVVLEEADLFAPEGKLRRPGDEQMLGAVYDLVRRGRGRGIGSTLITQRSASLSKEVLTQAEILVALRTTGPHDRKAIEAWIELHGDEAQRDEVLASLASLPTGNAWVWWPVEGILRQVRIRERRTFDSSATPKPGQTRRQPKTLADVDLEQLRESMAATIEKAKAEDPRELRRQIRELEQRVRAAEQRTKLLEQSADREPERVVEQVPIEVPVVDEEMVNRLTMEVDAMRKIADLAGPVHAAAEQIAEGLRRAAEARQAVAKVRTSATAREGGARPGPTPRAPAPPTRAPAAARPAGDGPVSGPQQRILDALAQLETIGIALADKTQLALFSQASPKSSSYTNNLGALRTAGLIDYPRPAAVALTSDGRLIANADSAPSTTDELHEFVFGLVGAAKARLLQVLIDVYPNALSKTELAERAGASPTSSSFTNNLGSLRALGLIDYPSQGHVAALPVLFLEDALSGAPR